MTYRIIPQTRWGDRLIAFKKFVRRHRRLPSRDKMLFNDVLYRIKTSDMILDPLRVFVSDKEFVKTYVRDKVGEEYNVLTMGIIRRPEDLETFKFPETCCIKPTHACGQVMFRRDGSDVDTVELAKWFKVNQYSSGREANYRYLQPKIIIEPILSDGHDLHDYKIFCYNGMPRLIMFDQGRHRNHLRNLLDLDWQDTGLSLKYPRSDVIPPRPANLEEMLDVAAALSKEFKGLIRIDFYVTDGCIKVGEITNVSGNAQAEFIPPASELAASKILFSK